jgi:urease accessory protein
MLRADDRPRFDDHAEAALKDRPMNRSPWLRPLAAVLLSALTVVAQAQPLPDGHALETSMQGLVSGLAEPLLDVDHLLFLLGAAALVAAARVPVGRGVQLLGAFAVTASIGTALSAGGLSLPWAETGMALTLVVLALALLRLSLGQGSLLLLAGAGGLLHGYAYGGSITQSAAAPALAYAAGLLLVQAVMLCAVHGGWSTVIERSPVWRPSARRGLALLLGVVGTWALGVAG